MFPSAERQFPVGSCRQHGPVLKGREGHQGQAGVPLPARQSQQEGPEKRHGGQPRVRR